MEISFTPKLAAYMQSKGYHAIALEPISPKGCCADMTELHTRFVRDKDVPTLKAKGCSVLAGPDGCEVLILSNGLYFDKAATFDLRSFFGIKDITVKGITAFRL